MSDKLSQYDVLPQDDGSIVLHNEHYTPDRHVKLPDVENPIKVNGVWVLAAYPTSMVIELETGILKMAHITPLEPLNIDRLRDYKAYHPRKCKGQPLPAYLYKFYGLEKNDETATETLHTRVTLSEKTKIETAAENQGKNVSELIRQFIRELDKY